VRFLQIGADGSIKEQGYFLSLAQRLKADGWSPGLCYLTAPRI
jgi:hypothetical protein